jgi:transcriptional regulator with XRE-family HTH domain
VCLRLQERGDHQEDLADVCGVSKQRVSQMVARGCAAWETVAWMAD